MNSICSHLYVKCKKKKINPPPPYHRHRVDWGLPEQAGVRRGGRKGGRWGGAHAAGQERKAFWGSSCSIVCRVKITVLYTWKWLRE